MRFTRAPIDIVSFRFVSFRFVASRGEKLEKT